MAFKKSLFSLKKYKSTSTDMNFQAQNALSDEPISVKKSFFSKIKKALKIKNTTSAEKMPEKHKKRWNPFRRNKAQPKTTMTTSESSNTTTEIIKTIDSSNNSETMKTVACCSPSNKRLILSGAVALSRCSTDMEMAMPPLIKASSRSTVFSVTSTDLLTASANSSSLNGTLFAVASNSAYDVNNDLYGMTNSFEFYTRNLMIWESEFWKTPVVKRSLSEKRPFVKTPSSLFAELPYYQETFSPAAKKKSPEQHIVRTLPAIQRENFKKTLEFWNEQQNKAASSELEGDKPWDPPILQELRRRNTVDVCKLKKGRFEIVYSKLNN